MARDSEPNELLQGRQYFENVKLGIESEQLQPIYQISLDFKNDYAQLGRESIARGDSDEEIAKNIGQLVERTATSLDPAILEPLIDRPYLFQSLNAGRAERQKDIALPLQEEGDYQPRSFGKDGPTRENDAFWNALTLSYVSKDLDPDVREKFNRKAVIGKMNTQTKRFQLSEEAFIDDSVLTPAELEVVANTARSFKAAVIAGKDIEVNWSDLQEDDKILLRRAFSDFYLGYGDSAWMFVGYASRPDSTLESRRHRRDRERRRKESN